ncbi:sphingomyelin phosphodiesterase [Vibrio europaeus]|uniref:Phospholipase n=1 Tax=Vibrio europaeus TaxID=300876 RepID=A0A178J6P9_9VIBR|nr:sphingomyelin phosphodiesterase [Vibrio europaeus]MDC5705429.1 sphingomyelin phosphodiesterase [Vibrio europaeus]MDC5710708.1 sphingomyelin phosphodiesterase [Vibrio europaeus]MDC5715798.1 sphingomyelin phosphodiesterase [Vibrio europaeus]MDC5719959.1 sphingomyelin phosphodiesterase [Vibrio europaeus]MDC5724154.1 sphingomyelin phosphodiesterase [Vibrio europaeus]
MNFKQCSIALVALMASSAFADTDVYLTNNSGQALTIQVSHDGTDILKHGEEWKQHVDTLGPWETKQVMSFNRWEGVKSGKTYRFSTVVSNPVGESVTLNQVMKGHWYNSSIEYGVAAADVSLSLKDDRNIHRYNSQSFGERSAELAFKSAKTARYDDLYYTITPQKVEEQVENDDSTLKMMTYNIWALPVIASHIGDRYDLIPEYVKGYDVLALQEVFASGRDAFLRELAKEYPYQTKMLDKEGINIYDGGVMIVSRYPIVNQAQYVFPDCTGTDCFADKGVNYAEVIKGGKAYHVFATHTASFDTDTARDYRQRQFKQMRQLATSLNIPKTDTVVYSGDFNVNKLKFPGDYQQMIANLSAIEPTYSGYTASTFDPRINDFAGEAMSGGENVEYLDYVMVSNEYQVKSYNDNRVDVPRSTDERLWKHYNLSDHFPVTAVVK